MEPLTDKKPLTFKQKIKAFLDIKTGSLITSAMALCIGFAFKDLITTCVNAIIEPIIIYIVTVSQLYKIYDFRKFISNQDNMLNISNVTQQFISFIIIIVVVYLFFQHFTFD